MLPDKALAPAYNRVIWVWVYRDFKKSPEDRAAERVELRFGVTAYPMHFLVDPGTLEELADTGREVKGFLQAVERAKPRPAAAGVAARMVEKVRAAEARARELEERPTVELARERLGDDDVVVRLRALEVLQEVAPAVVAERAVELLAVSNDAFRFEVCRALRKAGSAQAAPALRALLEHPPGESRNPNALRCEAATALGSCGDEEAVGWLGPFALKRDYLNALTSNAVGAVVEIAVRCRGARAAACEVLLQAFPAPPKADDPYAKTTRGHCERLARLVHDGLGQLTGRKVDFPAAYDEASLGRLRDAWSKEMPRGAGAGR
ncbi:MAG: HEAT repeat domain-containing protein [Planctomycetes bacterium]|nr:HEAT repeat domain-containing protein [Planctomycetota bacterium]